MKERREDERDLYLALGDSITVGYEATRTERSYVQLVLRTAKQLSLAEQGLIVAQNGWTIRDLLQAVQSMPPAVWQQANLATVLIGGNEFRKRLFWIVGSPTPKETVNHIMGKIETDLQQLFAFLEQMRVPHVIVSTVYNPAPHFPLAEYALPD